jgi:two-component system NtrC family sensor kinase
VETKLTALYDLGQKLILLRDPQEIAEAVLDIAVRVLDLQDTDFLLVDAARRELHLAARRGLLQHAGRTRLPLDGEQGITVAAAQNRQPLYVPDVRKDPRYVFAGFPAISELAVPVQIENRVLGVLNVESTQLDAFSPADQELLCILASQAALALENARLHAEEHRQAEEMTVLNQLNRRISASLDLQDTLEAIATAAAELIPCALSEISLWDEKTQRLTLRALEAEPRRACPLGTTYPPGHGYTGWLVHHKKPLLVPDVAARQDIRPHLLSGELPYEAYAGVPLLIGQELIGILVLVANEVGAFHEQHIDLLEALAAQAAIAIRNARLYEEVTRRNRELSALCAVAEAINRPLELGDLLQHALERVIEVTHAHGGGIRLLDLGSAQMVLFAHYGLSEQYNQAAATFPVSQEIVGWVARTGEPALSEDIWTDSRVSPEVRALLKEVGHRSLAQVPLRFQDRVVGTLGLVAHTPAFFQEDDLMLLNTIGHQLGTAIANARLRQEALMAERLAAVGRVAASVAHDLRSPLGGILRSAEFLARPELSTSTRRKLSQAIISLARRLMNTTQEILDYVRGEKLPLKRLPCSLAEFLDEVLAVLEVDFSDRGIEVVQDCGYSGEVVMDTDRMAQVVYNIAANARDAMPCGGKFTVTTRENKGVVELRFADTGPGVPEELRDRIFEPFFTHGKRDGAGLGLSIAQRIVEEHGGKLSMESRNKEGATFVVSLPL